MRNIDKVIVHCSDSPNGRHNTVYDIDAWHKERGFRRVDADRLKFNSDIFSCGYHYVIYIDGSIHQGRAENEIGAHCQGENQTSIGICMIGKDQFTPAQWTTLGMFASTKGLAVYGHREFASAIAQGKECPNLDVQEWVARGYEPEAEDVLV